jgi:hypothetical protein
MKYYGRDGNKKMKKRYFEVIMNTATKGIYTDFTPIKVAKKVTSELVGKKKHIIFTLREKRKSGKNYGPYIGSIKDGRVVARIHKMSGGDLIDCVFNKITVNNFKVDVKEQPKIKITKFCFTKATIIFFDSLIHNKKNYYKYAIYREKDNVFVIELEISDEEKLEIKPIGINKIENKEFLQKIIEEINEKQIKNPKFAVKIKEKIQQELSSIENHKQKIFSSPTKLFSQPKNPEEEEFNRKLNQEFKIVLSKSPRNFLTPNLKLFQKPTPINNSEKEFLQFYICPIENFAEVRRNAFSQIGFGFDPTLFTGTLYYKYLYFGKDTFRELVKVERGYDDKEIEISNIDLYDLLCLMEFAKLNNNILGDLLTLIYTNINQRLKTGLITISLSDHSFFNLKNSNYNKKRITNLGKIKRKQEFTKDNTYYFFGRNSPNNFKYVCYLLDDKLYYFEIGSNIKESHQLEELKDRNAIQELQELKSFIILRRLGTNNPNFGEPIYQKVSEIIRKLKLEEIKRLK